MTKTQLLVGSLSNDLFRVANCRVNGSTQTAIRFAKEAKRWAAPLRKRKVASYIKKIAQDVFFHEGNSISLHQAEKYLMYGILLQNYALHQLDNSSKHAKIV